MSDASTVQNKNLIREFEKLFKGYERAYGQFTPFKGLTSLNGKQEGKYSTIKDTIPEQAYSGHLGGTHGLGIIPVNEKGESSFGVLDVDVYGDDLSLYRAALLRSPLPLSLFRSKSGGLHVYVFFKPAASAVRVQKALKNLAEVYGIDILTKRSTRKSPEVFPKQTKAVAGKQGSFINLPYFGGNNTDRYMFSEDGEALPLRDALDYIKDRQTSIESFEQALNALPFGDAPPCLQTLLLLDPFESVGNRNTFLFSVAVFLKKKDEDGFDDTLHAINRDLSNPLPEKEVQETIVASIKQRDYFYKCREAPLCDFCRSGKCKGREYGVGREGGSFSSLEFGRMRQIGEHEPLYTWEVRQQDMEEWATLEFRNETELIDQRRFGELCLRHLKRMPSKLKEQEWRNLLNTAAAEMEQVKLTAAEDTSSYSLFLRYALEFILSTVRADTRQQINSGRVFFDEGLQTYFFRGIDLQEYVVKTKGLKGFANAEYLRLYRKMGAVNKVIRLTAEKTLRVWSIDKSLLDTFELPWEGTAPDFTQHEDF